MPALIVTNVPEDWPANIKFAEVVDARDYLIDPQYSTGTSPNGQRRGLKVFNLCRSYRYQSTGYYVSLLAEARGHIPIPSVTTIQELKTPAVVRMVSEDVENQVQKLLAPIHSDEFTLSIYFGQNLAKRYSRLARTLFNQFQSPLLRAKFVKSKKGWQLKQIRTIAANEVPDSHWPFLIEAATSHFGGRVARSRPKQHYRFDMAILHNPADPEPPSDEKALKQFVKAANSLDMSAEMITKDDYGRLAEFDALFIRETTFVDQYTYRFAQRAAHEGLIVIDDPLSIVRCTNKVYLAELLTRHQVPIPRTLVLHRENCSGLDELGFPCVLKKPDSSFSQGVVKAKDAEERQQSLEEFFRESDLVVAQEFLPTTFDWRIGIVDRQPLYACKYYMARGHWQIIRQDRAGRGRYGKSETVPIEAAPKQAIEIALKAADLVGDGLYGVDVKESDGKFYVIEVNDNPNIDRGYEDAILKDELYRRIMQVFLSRIEQRKASRV